MSAPSCVAGNLCIMKDQNGKQLPLSSSMKHFCLHCGHQKHAPCGHEYDVIRKNENEFKDILDVIAPRKKNDKGEEVGDRPKPKPAGEEGQQLEICFRCVHQIRSSTTPAAASAPAPMPVETPATNTTTNSSVQNTADVSATAAAEQPIEFINSSDDESPSASTSAASNKAPPSKTGKKPMWLFAHQSKSKKKAEEKEKVHKKAQEGKHKKKGNRAGLTAEYTNEEKLKIVEKYSKLANHGGFKAAYAQQKGVHPRTITRWRKDKKKLEQAVADGRAKKKTVFKGDSLLRVKLGLKTFYAENERLPKEHKLPISGKCTCCSKFLSHLSPTLILCLILSRHLYSQQVFSLSKH